MWPPWPPPPAAKAHWRRSAAEPGPKAAVKTPRPLEAPAAAADAGRRTSRRLGQHTAPSSKAAWPRHPPAHFRRLLAAGSPRGPLPRRAAPLAPLPRPRSASEGGCTRFVRTSAEGPTEAKAKQPIDSQRAPQTTKQTASNPSKNKIENRAQKHKTPTKTNTIYTHHQKHTEDNHINKNAYTSCTQQIITNNHTH